MDGAKLTYWMTKKSIPPSELAERVGVTPTYISNLRTGKKAGSVKLWNLIAKVLEVELKELC